jgi:hypothetical protein
MRPNRLTPVLGTLCLAGVAFADDLHVPADYPTIQAAIDAAQPGDRVLVADGTYSGLGNVDLDLAGKSLIIQSVNGPDFCTIDGVFNPGSNAFLLVSGEDVLTRIEGFTITNFTTSAGDEGAIRLVGSSPIIEDCRFINCSTANESGVTTPGSAIVLIDSTPQITDCTFAFNEGSAVHTDADSVTYIIGCLFEDNITRPDDGRGGGAVLNEGFTLTFTSTYRRNRVEAIAGPARGGAFAHLGGSLDLTTATFEDNAVSGPGALGGASVYATTGFVMNSNIVREHSGDHAGGTILIDATNTAEPFIAFAAADYDANAVGAVRIDDPDGIAEVRIGSSDFCHNTPFDIQGPYADWGGNDVCCPADLDGTGGVGVGDLLAMLEAWGACAGCPADLNDDQVVDVSDLLVLLSAWGGCPELP